MLPDDRSLQEQLEPILQKEARLFEEMVNLPAENRTRLLEAIKGFEIIEASFDDEERPSNPENTRQ